MKKLSNKPMTAFFVFASAFILSLPLTSCGNKKVPVLEPVTLVMAEVNPETSICGRMDNAFKEKVEELSKGMIKVDVKYSGVIGDESQILNMMFSGDDTVQLSRVSANLSAYGAPKTRLISIPYTFSSPGHFWTFAKSDLAKELLDDPYKLGLGVKGLCYAEEGFRNFFTTQPVKSVEDLNGKNMRVSGQTLTDIAEALNANPVKVPFTDLYMSLQTGAVEIADQPITNYLTNSLYKVAPYMILDGHMLGAVQIAITAKAWDALSAEQQAIISTAASYASDYCRTIQEQEEKNAMAALEADGATFISVDNLEDWQKACESVISEGSKDYPELYSQILSLNDKPEK